MYSYELTVMQSLSRRKKSKKHWVVYTIILCVLLLLTIGTGFIRPIVIGMSRPLVKTANNARDTARMADVWSLSKGELVAQIDALKAENEQLVLTKTNLEKEKSESLVWSTLFAETYTVDSLIRTLIISKPNQSPYDTFILDAGSVDGVREGAIVTIDTTAILGHIDSVQEYTSTAVLFSSPRVETVARLERSNSDVTLVGTGGGNMVVEIPKEIETALGDRVLLPAFHNKVIGIIRDITLDDRDANKKLYITLPTNILTLDHVFVEK